MMRVAVSEIPGPGEKLHHFAMEGKTVVVDTMDAEIRAKVRVALTEAFWEVAAMDGITEIPWEKYQKSHPEQAKQAFKDWEKVTAAQNAR